MSHDELLASLFPATETALAPAATPRQAGPVVVPLHVPPPGLVARRAAAHARADGRAEGTLPRAIVAQIGDYLRTPPATTAAIAPSRRRLRATGSAGRLAEHARELDRVLCQHIETQLERIARHAPDLGQSVETVRRSLDLLLKLRGR